MRFGSTVKVKAVQKPPSEGQAVALETYLQNTKTLDCITEEERSNHLREVIHKYFPQNKWF